MKIYVVTAGSYSDYEICAVFTTKEKADLYCAIHNGDTFHCGDDYYVEEYDADPDIRAAEGVKAHYYVTLYTRDDAVVEDTMSTVCTTAPLREFERDTDYRPWDPNGYFKRYEGVFLTDDKEKLRKIFYDWTAKQDAEAAGL